MDSEAVSSGLDAEDIPFITTDQMREVDRIMVEEYGISLVQMMENAGGNLASLARSRFLDGNPAGHRVLVLAGRGGNGGGGLVCARRLHTWGARVHVWLATQASQLAEVPRHQLAILERMHLPVQEAGAQVELPPADLIIDALIGYSLRGAPGGTAAELIRAANGHDAPILALDVPSGLNATTGAAGDPAIHATATMTLALPKEGLRAAAAREQVGELYLADIGVPPEVYASPAIGVSVGPIFATDGIVRLW